MPQWRRIKIKCLWRNKKNNKNLSKLLLPIFGFQKKKKRNIYIQKKSKRRHSIEAIFTVFLNITAVALKAGDVGSDRGAVFNQEARLATDVPRHRDARDCYQNNACVLWL